MSQGTNIFAHVIDDASTVKVVNSTTVFSGDDLQSCLEEIDEHALSPIPISPTATETTQGITYVATDADMLDNTVDDKVVTPNKLAYWLENYAQATETSYGLVEIATNTEMSDSGNDTRVVTPAKLQYYADNIRVASTTQSGFYRLATTAEAVAGTGDGVMTPSTTLDAINAWAGGTASQANETTKGLIRIATTTEVNDPTNDDLAVTPHNLDSRSATTTRRGAFYLPTQTVADARTSNDHVITVGTMDLFEADSTNLGFVKLINDLTTDDSTAALSAAMGKALYDDKLTGTGGEVTGELKVHTMTSLSTGDDIISNGIFTSKSLKNAHPVGSLYFSSDNTNPSTYFGGTWSKYAEGRVLIGAGTGTDSRGQSMNFSLGQTGGEYAHQLTVNEMPSHQHQGWGNGSTSWPWGYSAGGKIGAHKIDYHNRYYNTSPVGGDGAHNNIQPYIAVNIWRRTA